MLSIVLKGVFVLAFVAFAYYGVDMLLAVALNKGLPQLPSNVAFFISRSGTDVAIQLYISIITAGWVGKQTISYVRTL